MLSPALRQSLRTPIPCGKVIPAFRGAAVAAAVIRRDHFRGRMGFFSVWSLRRRGPPTCVIRAVPPRSPLRVSSSRPPQTRELLALTRLGPALRWVFIFRPFIRC